MSMSKRLWYTIMLNLIRNSRKRAEYAKDKRIFNKVGENVALMIKKVPLYPELIRFHNNVRIASGVTFITHDNIHYLLNRKYPDKQFLETIGCIEIMDNVFVGSNSTIMYNVRIGPNTIIAAGSVVTKDIPENSVAAGVPAKVIGSFEKYVEKVQNFDHYPRELRPSKQKIKSELVNLQWDRFERKRD